MLIVAKRSASFIKVGVAYMYRGIHVSRHLKEELAWSIDKWLQFTISHPTRDLQRSYRLAINNFQLSEQS